MLLIFWLRSYCYWSFLSSIAWSPQLIRFDSLRCVSGMSAVFIYDTIYIGINYSMRLVEWLSHTRIHVEIYDDKDGWWRLSWDGWNSNEIRVNFRTNFWLQRNFRMNFGGSFCWFQCRFSRRREKRCRIYSDIYLKYITMTMKSQTLIWVHLTSKMLILSLFITNSINIKTQCKKLFTQINQNMYYYFFKYLRFNLRQSECTQYVHPSGILDKKRIKRSNENHTTIPSSSFCLIALQTALTKCGNILYIYIYS